MGVALFHEQRLDDRKKLTGFLPARLKRQETDINCRFVDISENGLGIASDYVLKNGAQVELHVKDNVIVMRVAWAAKDRSKKDSFRYGLEVQTDNIDLESFVTSSLVS